MDRVITVDFDEESGSARVRQADAELTLFDAGDGAALEGAGADA